MDEIFAPEGILERFGGVPLLESTEEEVYWADDSVSRVIDRVFEVEKENQRSLDQHGLFNKIARSRFYYYGYFENWSDWGSTAISLTGENGQILDFTVNYYRYLLRQLLTMLVADEPRYRVAPANLETKSRVQARLGKRVLEFYTKKKGVLDELALVAEDALVHGIGFCTVTWDPAAGKAVYDEAMAEEVYEGDVVVEQVDFMDIIWEYDRHSKQKELNWFARKKRINKWDLITRFPEKIKEILQAGKPPTESPYASPDTASSEELDDKVSVIEWYHRRCDALPDGRYCMFLDAETDEVLLDIDLPYRRLPLYVMVPAKIPGMLLGWTPAFDIQKQQELLGEELAKIATIHDNLGFPLLWMKTGSKQADPALWLGNIAYVESEAKPELVSLADIPEDLYRVIDMLIGSMEKVVGLSRPQQGEAAGSVRANRMQLFLAEQSRRFNSPIEAQYYKLFENVGTAILETLKNFAHTERVIEVIGKNNEDQLINFTGGDLTSVSGVNVEAGSPLTRTLEGRLEVVTVLGQHNVSIAKEELVSILTGAPLDSILQGQAAQLELVSAENEELMRGGAHRAMPTDNHLLHIKKHAELTNSTEVRLSGEVNENVYVAIMEHYTLYNDPQHFGLQVALGFAEMPPMGPTPAGAGGPMPPPGPGAPAPRPAAKPQAGSPQPQPENEELQGVT